MKRWALLTVGLYMLILLVLAGPVILVCFADDYRPGPLLEDLAAGYGPIYGTIFEALAGKEDAPDAWIGIVFSPWTWALVMGLAQAALLVVPVRVESRRPVSARWLIWPALAALVMLAVLTGTMLMVAWETAENTPVLKDPTVMTAIACGVGFVWSIWAFLFGFYTVRGGRDGFMKRLCRSLVAGSILELLVAVPAHVLARTRNYCCAGFGTFWGIAAGISVMLFAFGPAVFVLFARRYAGVRRPPRQGPPQPIGQSAADGDADIPAP